MKINMFNEVCYLFVVKFYFLFFLDYKYLDEGVDVMWWCLVYGKLMFVYLWYKNGVFFQFIVDSGIMVCYVIQ